MPLSSLLLPEVFPMLAVIVGLVLGSFYSVCISRSIARLRMVKDSVDAPPATSILWPPSHCPHCRTRLRARYLVPVLSYLALGGRCGVCHAPIHPGYLLVELLSGSIAGALALRYGPSAAFLVCLIFSGLLIVASGIDFGTFILPDTLTLGGILPAMLCAVSVFDMSWTETALGATLGGGLFWGVRALFWTLRGIEALGMGDVKLMILLGALCGPLALPVIVITAGVSALLAFPLLTLSARGNGGSIRELPIPFGPFLSFGALLYLLFGPQILRWWLG